MIKIIKLTINMHEISITCPNDKEPSESIKDDLIENINHELLNFNDGGTETINSLEYNWEIEIPKSYLEQKVEILQDKGEVVFEHDCMIYAISGDDNEGYEINMYDLHTNNFIAGECLDADDGGHCTGSAKDAVYFMINNKN